MREDFAGERGPDRNHLLEMLLLVYDEDGSGDFSNNERAALLEDFTVRCEALHARLLEDFDADGDGELSEEEMETARAELESWREERRGEMEECRPEGGRPEEGMASPLEMAFDADGDGSLSDDELETLRTEVREHIRNGDPPFPPPPGRGEGRE